MTSSVWSSRPRWSGRRRLILRAGRRRLQGAGDRVTLNGGIRREEFRVEVPDFVTHPAFGAASVEGGRRDDGATTFHRGVLSLGAAELFGSFAQRFSNAEIGRLLSRATLASVDAALPRAQEVDHHELRVRGTASRAQAAAFAFYSTSELGTTFLIDPSSGLPEIRAPERTRGFEAVVDAELSSRWRLGASWSWQVGELDPEEDGLYKSLPGFRIAPPKITAYAEPAITSGWRLRGQILYAGEWIEFPATERFGESVVDPVWLVDLYTGARARRLGAQRRRGQSHESFSCPSGESGVQQRLPLYRRSRKDGHPQLFDSLVAIGTVRKLSLRVHRWVSRALGLPVLVVCVSGGILVFCHEIDRLHEGDVSAVHLPEEPHRPVSVWIRLPGDPRPNVGSSHVWIDPYRNEVTAAADAESMPLAARLDETWMITLHFGAFAGLPLRLAYAAAGLAPLLLLTTGLVVWWSKRRRSVTSAPPEDREGRSERSGRRPPVAILRSRS